MTSAKISTLTLPLLILITLSGCTSAATSFNASCGFDGPMGNVAVADKHHQDPLLSSPCNDNGEIMAGDVLEISAYQVSELDRNVRVEQDGTISLLLIGQVQTAGKTAQELENDLEQIYGVKYLQNPEISVFINERSPDQTSLPRRL